VKEYYKKHLDVTIAMKVCKDMTGACGTNGGNDAQALTGKATGGGQITKAEFITPTCSVFADGDMGPVKGKLGACEKTAAKGNFGCHKAAATVVSDLAYFQNSETSLLEQDSRLRDKGPCKTVCQANKGADKKYRMPRRWKMSL